MSRPIAAPARPARRWVLAGLTGLLAGSSAGLIACERRQPVAWDDVPPSPGATSFEGAVIEAVLGTRLASRLDERGLRLLGSRLEALPAGVGWAEHQAFRDAHAAGLGRVRETVPEPDAPVLMAEYAGPGRTLFVIARATDDARRLVVLTALAAPR